MSDIITPPSGPWILAQNIDGGTFKWHRVKSGIVCDACPFEGALHLTYCDERHLGESSQETAGHSTCSACEALAPAIEEAAESYEY